MTRDSGTAGRRQDVVSESETRPGIPVSFCRCASKEPIQRDAHPCKRVTSIRSGYVLRCGVRNFVSFSVTRITPRGQEFRERLESVSFERGPARPSASLPR